MVPCGKLLYQVRKARTYKNYKCLREDPGEIFRLTDNPHHPERARAKVGYDLHENDQITREGEHEFMPDLITR